MRYKGIGDKEEARLLAARYSHLTLAMKYLLLVSFKTFYTINPFR
jgi:hypothetical protein